ncbi:MAG: prepilin peptidase [Planctomycetaceae bacterium]|jgi:prepilin signal peptidase PulO-like enzyme (type II secretory pathway)|nr:prepilin peptidase [Planctomycetaceae bacterium]
MIDSDPVVVSILFVWLTFFGMCIGSFLNVVIYRLPRGKSLSDPPSHCPNCNHPIRWYDNVPVFGWLLLRGKCRDCKEPISIRYPVAEAMSGCVFGTIALLALLRNDNNSIPEIFCCVLTFSGLIVTFLAAGFIEEDGKSIPLRLFIPIAVPALAMPYLIQYSFHIPLFVHPVLYLKTGNESVNWFIIFYYIILCFLFLGPFIFSATLFKNFSKKFAFNNQNKMIWFYSGILIGLYFGSLSLPLLILFALLFFFVQKTSLRKQWTAQKLLSLTTFLGIIFILIFFR